MHCDTPDLGRIKSVGLFLLDDCLAPIYDLSAGYIDDCPAAVETSDNLDEGEDFTRRCANGQIKRFIKGEQSLQDIEVNVDFHWLDPTWVALSGGASPVMHNGEVIGWSDCTRSKFNVAVVVWQEILGADACDPTIDEPGCNDYVRLYPLKGARLTEEGTIGAEDSFIRLSGSTSDSHALGSGPLPLACDPATGLAEWLTDCLPSGCHRFKFIGGPAPDICGAMDTEAPPVPCVAESPTSP
jgi:hypothetical protein